MDKIRKEPRRAAWRGDEEGAAGDRRVRGVGPEGKEQIGTGGYQEMGRKCGLSTKDKSGDERAEEEGIEIDESIVGLSYQEESERSNSK